MLPHEGCDLPCVDRFPGQLSRCVMAAWQPNHVEIEPKASHFIDDFARKIYGKSQIVFRRNEPHWTSLHFEQSRNEWHRTDWFPELAQLFQRQLTFDSLPHMLGRNALPNNVGKISRHVIKNADIDCGFMREREERRARSNARPQDS